MHLVVGALLVRDGRVLLAHRSPTKRWYPDVWDLVGGHVDDAETLPEALAREVDEELGVTLPGDPGAPLAHVVDPTGPGGGLDITIWAVHSWTGEPANQAPQEHDDLRWFTLAETDGLALAHPTLRPLLHRVLASAGH